MDDYHIIAFTHRSLSVNDFGVLHIEEEKRKERFSFLKEIMGLDEIMFLSTCNRVEFLFLTEERVDDQFLNKFFQTLYSDFSSDVIASFVQKPEIYNGIDAVEHLMKVASSLDSMIVGEREIITQVRKDFELSRKQGLSGDFIRILLRKTIETAKQIYTETSIAKKPVSVVSLAYHKLRELNVPLDARFLIIGAGVTNTNMGRFLKKHGFTNFSVFNRTVEKAEKLADDLGGKAYPLAQLEEFDKGFDVIITCTAAESHIITPEIYEMLLQGETTNKVVIDIAIPQDLSPEIKEKHPVTHISVEFLQQISNQNLKERAREIVHAEKILKEALEEFKVIHHQRIVELAMRVVPEKVKEIKKRAMEDVFSNELAQMDDQSKETLEKVIAYMEKKYISGPMLMAKEILLNSKK